MQRKKKKKKKEQGPRKEEQSLGCECVREGATFGQEMRNQEERRGGRRQRKKERENERDRVRGKGAREWKTWAKTSATVDG